MKTELSIVQGCLNGDISCQKDLYTIFASKMMGVCWRYAKTKEDAEDLLQDGFLRVFSDLHQYNGTGSLEGWIRKVIVNVALQHIRKRKIVFAPILEVENNRLSDDSHHLLFSRFGVQDLLKVLSTLPSGARYIFNLYVIEGYSHKEIAGKLDISVGTSKSQLSKARKMLGNKLIEQDKSFVNEK